VLKIGIIVGLILQEVISKFFILCEGPIGITRMKLMAIVIKVGKRKSTLNSWICRDEDSKQLHVQLLTQNFHLMYG
jgi:hypothetical protein